MAEITLFQHTPCRYLPAIHSSGQIEHYWNLVHDKSMKVGGLQCIITNDEYVMPINIINGLPYVPMRPYTDEEWERLPHVLLTAHCKWDPRVLDNTIEDIDAYCSNTSEKHPPNTEQTIQTKIFETPEPNTYDNPLGLQDLPRSE